MKIVIIRHAKVNMKWEKKYDSKQYDLACKKYDESEIVPISEIMSIKDSADMVYISDLPRSYETACQLFGRRDFCRTSLVNEVPSRSFKDTDKKYPLWIWKSVSRIQWFFNSKRQPETREETIIRARKTIELVENNNEDCFIITHGFYMRTLVKELRSKGYKIERKRKVGIANLDRIIARK